MTPEPHLNARLKRSAKRALHGLLKQSAPGPRHAETNRILTYHSVGARRHETNVAPDMFRRQIAWLAETQTVISAEEAATGRAGVAITFDDGYLDNLTDAAPILAEFRLTATVFVVAGRVGGSLDHDADRESARLLGWDEVRELETGGWSVGAHTMNHRRLTELTTDEKRREITGSCALLEKELGHPVSGFAYPYGTLLDYDAVSKRLVREAGCTYAVSNRFGPNGAHADWFALRRINIDGGDTLESFRAKVEGRLDRIALFDTRMGARVRRTINAVIRT